MYLIIECKLNMPIKRRTQPNITYESRDQILLLKLGLVISNAQRENLYIDDNDYDHFA